MVGIDCSSSAYQTAFDIPHLQCLPSKSYGINEQLNKIYLNSRCVLNVCVHTERVLTESCCQTNQCAYSVANSECARPALDNITTTLTNEKVCLCSAGFVPLGTKICLPTALAIGDQCDIDAQCRDIASNATCVGSQCTLPSPPQDPSKCLSV